jgi:hypothetical protein
LNSVSAACLADCTCRSVALNGACRLQKHPSATHLNPNPDL